MAQTAWSFQQHGVTLYLVASVIPQKRIFGHLTQEVMSLGETSNTDTSLGSAEEQPSPSYVFESGNTDKGFKQFNDIPIRYEG